MRYITLICWLSLSVSFFSNAQTRKAIDAINNTKADVLFSNLLESTTLLKKNFQDAQQIGYLEGMGLSANLLGKTYYLMGNFEKSAAYNMKALRLFQQIGDYTNYVSTSAEFGFQLKTREMHRANRYMQEAIYLLQKHHIQDTKITLPIYNNYGTLKLMQRQLDSAQFYFDFVLKALYKENSLVGIPYTLNNLASLSLVQKKYHKAWEYIQASNKYRIKEEHAFGRVENEILTGCYYRSTNQLDSAFFCFQTALQQAKHINYYYAITECLDSLLSLSLLTQNYSAAYNYKNDLTHHQDSVLNFQTRQRVEELQLEYHTEQKDKEIAQKTAEISSYRFRVIILTLSVVFLAFVALYIYQRQRSKRKQQQAAFILEQEREEARKAKELYEEKERIARELHDNIGAQLTFINASLENLSLVDEKVLKEKAEKIADFGKNTMKDLRSTVWAMKMNGGTIRDIYDRLMEIKSRIESSSELHIFMEGNEMFELNPTEMLNVFRIIQETLQNALKHSQAESIRISMHTEANVLFIRVEDNGVGFDSDIETSGNGMRNIRARAKAIHASFSVKSELNKGTVLELKLAK